MRNFISYADSINIMKNIDFKTACTEKLFLTNALNHIIANDIVADHNSPAHPTSAMDGYAIRFEDQEYKTLEIIDLDCLRLLAND